MVKEELTKGKLAFRSRLEQLLMLAKDKKGVLEQSDISDAFADLELDQVKIEQINFYLI